MKRNGWLMELLGGTLAVIIAFGGALCLVSGFSMENANLWQVFFWCACLSVTGVLAFRYRKVLWLLGALALLGGVLLWQGTLVRSVLALIHRISGAYSGAYGWPQIGASGFAVTQALCLLCTVSQLLVLTVLYRGIGIWVAVAVSALPLASCMVITDAVPKEAYLFLLLLGLILLVMSQELRSRETEQAMALVKHLALPVAAFLLVLFLLVPRDTYALQQGAEKLESLVSQVVERLQQPVRTPIVDNVTTSQGTLSSQVNLKTVGPKKKDFTSVMEVTAARTETLYLRGYAYAEYSGTDWSAGDQSTQITWRLDQLEKAGRVEIETRNTHPVLYRPYYSYDMDILSSSFYPQTGESWREVNTGELTEYVMEQWKPKGELLSSYSDTYSRYMSQYLQLPEDTRARAERLVEDILGESVPVAIDEHVREKIYKIIDYVKSSASYDLDTPKMPGSQKDFALWFLEKSDTGYCVHFATAGAVLLRAAGIPTRYVTGYMVSSREGRAVTVFASDAHAWVEYCLPGLGWMPLEATPAGRGSSGTTQTQPGETSTQPRQTEPEPSRQETESDMATTPEEDTPDHGQAANQTKIDWKWVWAVLLPLLLIGLVIGQWKLRRYLREQRQSRGSTNDRALALWQEYAVLARLLRQTPDKQLYALAQKAKFSQYAITEQELESLNAGISALQESIRKKPLPARLIFRLLFAAY